MQLRSAGSKHSGTRYGLEQEKCRLLEALLRSNPVEDKVISRITPLRRRNDYLQRLALREFWHVSAAVVNAANP